ncbi:MAG: carbohydrate ABC transporter permease [Pseudomonadota bacterium]
MSGSKHSPVYNRPKRQISNHLVLMAGSLFMCGPVVYAFWSTIAAGASVQGDWSIIETSKIFSSVYGRLLSSEPVFIGMPSVPDMMMNSWVTATGFALITVTISLTAAYALTYFPVPRAGVVIMAIVATLYFPLETRILPTFLVADQLGLLNSRLGIILPLCATGIATLIFTITLRQMPDELTEAAQLDGANPIRFFMDFVLPIQLPIIMAVTALLFAIGWNQYLWPLMIATSNHELSTVVRGIGQLGGAGHYQLALGIIATVPPAIIGGIGLHIVQRGMIFETQ